ncbi:phospholipase [Microbacterium sp.]|uniref:aggregation-promoting factor C-terminal-like domain-containing protein n=1 Tax=Microbacterium sp. TaxID=51671 RepID=UPI00260CF085|nr:phospholipase [Microbacterium sp.]
MPKAFSLTPARSWRAAAVVAIGATLGVAVATGVTTAAPAFAESDGRAASVGATIFTVNPTDAALALESARTAVSDAETAVFDAKNSDVDLSAESTEIDTSALLTTITNVENANSPSVLLMPALMTTISDQTEQVAAQAAELRSQLDAAIEKKAAEEAAAKAAAEAAAIRAAANTPDGAKAAARQIAADEYGWGGDQFSCLSSLWQKESGWNYQAYNASSGATGIPQALPGSKMASAGADWQTNAVTQIRWGLDYIQRAYGSPCAAWGHSQSVNWY